MGYFIFGLFMCAGGWLVLFVLGSLVYGFVGTMLTYLFKGEKGVQDGITRDLKKMMEVHNARL
jgi:hypothetical protein